MASNGTAASRRLYLHLVRSLRIFFNLPWITLILCNEIFHSLNFAKVSLKNDSIFWESLGKVLHHVLVDYFGSKGTMKVEGVAIPQSIVTRQDFSESFLRAYALWELVKRKRQEMLDENKILVPEKPVVIF